MDLELGDELSLFTELPERRPCDRHRRRRNRSHRDQQNDALECRLPYIARGSGKDVFATYALKAALASFPCSFTRPEISVSTLTRGNGVRETIRGTAGGRGEDGRLGGTFTNPPRPP